MQITAENPAEVVHAVAEAKSRLDVTHFDVPGFTSLRHLQLSVPREYMFSYVLPLRYATYEQVLTCLAMPTYEEAVEYTRGLRYYGAQAEVFAYRAAYEFVARIHRPGLSHVLLQFPSIRHQHAVLFPIRCDEHKEFDYKWCAQCSLQACYTRQPSHHDAEHTPQECKRYSILRGFIYQMNPAGLQYGGKPKFQQSKRPALTALDVNSRALV